jgi:hypothetical protein
MLTSGKGNFNIKEGFSWLAMKLLDLNTKSGFLQSSELREDFKNVLVNLAPPEIDIVLSKIEYMESEIFISSNLPLHDIED